MAKNLPEAFSEFLVKHVRLDAERTKLARASTQWLIEEIKKFPNDGKFPPLHEQISIEYGSFPRKTKIRPLNDIDLMIVLHGQNASYNLGQQITAVSNNQHSPFFADLCGIGSNEISSIKVVNKFKEYLQKIPQYRKAEIKRNQEAVTLELQTYEWVFDIVPCFHTNPEWDHRSYYLIPDGSGQWKKTDPRIDKERVLSITRKHKIATLDIIRLVKYWNNRSTMPSAPSYMLENMVLNYYDQPFLQSSSSILPVGSVEAELQNVLQYISHAIGGQVWDPKNIQGDLNTLNWQERDKIRERAKSDAQRLLEARLMVQRLQIQEAFAKCQEVLGNDFPNYNPYGI